MIFNFSFITQTEKNCMTRSLNCLTASRKKFAFTLAEVLITLGIIGVVAALTMPILINNHQKQTFVTRGKWFYSFMSQALQRAEVDNGAMSNWTVDGNNADTDVSMQFFNNYIKNYIKYSDIKPCPSTITGDDHYNNHCIYLANGSVFWIRSMGEGKAVDLGFYADYNKGDTSDNYLLFMIRNGKFSTYSENWDGTRNGLFNSSRGFGCNGDGNSILAYCAKLIEYDGWKISKDYPWKAKSKGSRL